MIKIALSLPMVFLGGASTACLLLLFLSPLMDENTKGIALLGAALWPTSISIIGFIKFRTRRRIRT